MVLPQKFITDRLICGGCLIWNRTLHRWFGRWVRANVRKSADIIYVFSGVSEETLESFCHTTKGPQVWVARGSSHIRVQNRLLEEEEARGGVPLERPSSWLIAREEREYAMAQRIITLSSFAKWSFTNQSVPTKKVTLLLSAVNVSHFRPKENVILARRKRIKNSAPLHVLMVGTLSMRKGVIDLIEIARRLAGTMQFRFVGDVLPEALDFKKQAGSTIEFVRRVPEPNLGQHYAWGDVFLFPTIEDGFPAVLAQALAAGLPVLATPNSSAPDIVRQGETGWILPIRNPSIFIDQLLWCDRNRHKLEDMVRRLYSEFPQRDWQDMASDFELAFAKS